MPSTKIIQAFAVLELDYKQLYQKEKINSTYRKLARECHPDKGGTTEKFQELSAAYQTVLEFIELKNSSNKNNKKNRKKTNINLSFTEKVAALYTTISAVDKKLATYGTSETISLKELRDILKDIQSVLQKEIFHNEQNFVVIAINLKANANIFDGMINKIYSGPSPAFAAIVACAFISIGLGIVALMIAFSLPSNVVHSAAVLSGLIATPPVSGLLLGAICFFGAKSADKNRSEQQAEMRKITAAIKDLAYSIKSRQDKQEEEEELQRIDTQKPTTPYSY